MPSTTTLAKAKKCPKCHNTGTLVSEGRTTDPRYTGYVFTCEHKLCLWYNTSWVVTADDEDNVPMMDIGHTKKVFPKRKDMTEADRQRMRETFDDIL